MPTVGSNDVLIRVLKTAICGTDLHIYNWDAWARETIPVPMIVGHEFVGEVIETGDNVADFYPGRLSAARVTWSAVVAGTVLPGAGIFVQIPRGSVSTARALLQSM